MAKAKTGLSEDGVRALIKGYERTKSERSNFEGHWQEVAEVIYPDASDFLSPDFVQGGKRMQKVIESTGIIDNQLLAAGIYSLLTNPTTPWFAISTSDDKLNRAYDVSLWLEQCTNICLFEIQRPKAKFITASHEGYLSLGAFGNMVPMVTENLKDNCLNFQVSPLSRSFFTEDGDGNVQTLFRTMSLTPTQLVDMYGKENVSEASLKQYENEKESRIEVLHIITTRAYDPSRPSVATNHPWASYHIETKTRNVLRESGYLDQPFFATRFFKASGETYGRGPGMWALPDVQMLMEIKKTTLRGAQMLVTPAMQAPDNGFLAPVTMRPGGINFYRADTPGRIEPIQTGGSPGIGVDLIQDTRQLIHKAFYIDQLQLGFGPQMTATEVMQRTEEKLRLMGPMLGRLQSEFLGPMIQRVFGILLRAGKLPAPPDAVLAKGATLKITYTSSLARAQEQVQANGFQRMLELAMPLLNIKPDVADGLNGDGALRALGDMFSISKEFFNTQEQITATRQARLEQEQQRMKAEMAQQTAMTADAGSRAVKNMADSEIPLEEIL